MIGPIMIGPSSSHTAGVVRIGRVARLLLTEHPRQATITFYNSFASTYEGHGSDRAVIAGILNMHTDDERIREAFEHAANMGLSYAFKTVHNDSTLHPNTIRIELLGEKRRVRLLGVSKGGGLVLIREVDGFPTNFSAQAHTLFIKAKDVKGSIAFISSVINNDECNIGTMTVNRTGKNDIAKLVFEIDSPLRELTVNYLESLNWVKELIYIPFVE
jgi:L-serine dehydratase